MVEAPWEYIWVALGPGRRRVIQVEQGTQTVPLT
jgi:hypothetical protein